MKVFELSILLSILASGDTFSWDEIKEMISTLHDETEFSEWPIASFVRHSIGNMPNLIYLNAYVRPI